MAKILLVEDDENLREIYQARLMAEGYEIVSAKNGEEALVVAKQEKPDLIIADIMMPRISGFEMLDILRNTDGMKHVKVIMLTALGQAEDKARADKLGADRYLVKSQVTLEDIVHAASELLGGESNPSVPVTNEQSQSWTTGAPTPTPVAPSVSQTAMPPTTNSPLATNQQAVVNQPATTPIAVAQAPAAAPLLQQPTPASATPINQPVRQVPVFNQATGRPTASSTPGAPPVSTATLSPPTSPQAQNTSTPSEPNQPKAVNNASQLADAVNNLINGTPSKPNLTAQRGSVPPFKDQGSLANQQTMPQLTTPPSTASPQPVVTPVNSTGNLTQTTSAPRAFPTGAPAVAPSAAPVQSIKPAPQSQPEANTNITKPEAPTTPNVQTTAPDNTQDSITIKDKKTVEPLKPGNLTVSSDLNDLLQKENNNQENEAVNSHQPGQIFTPSGNTPGGDPNNISL